MRLTKPLPPTLRTELPDVNRKVFFMSETSKENRPPAPGKSSASAPVGQTVQMNPAILGQAANMNPDTDLFKQLDAASEMLEQAAHESTDSMDESLEPLPTIEQYMAALLARSQSPGGEPAAASPADLAPSTKAPAAKASNNALETSPSAAQSEEEGPWQRVSAPECRDTISELRELANVSARTSFNVHRGQQLVYEMHNKLTVSLVALVVSFALVSLANNVRSPAFFAAVAAWVVAMCWGVKYFQLGHQLQRLCFSGDDAASGECVAE